MRSQLIGVYSHTFRRWLLLQKNYGSSRIDHNGSTTTVRPDYLKKKGFKIAGIKPSPKLASEIQFYYLKSRVEN